MEELCGGRTKCREKGLDEEVELNQGHWAKRDAVEERATELAMVNMQGLRMFLCQHGWSVRREWNR